MNCPFLKESQVRFCEVAPFRKMIPGTSHPWLNERCSSPGWRDCPWAAGRLAQPTDGSHCPFLRESLVQYCSAAPVVRFIPHSDALRSCCQTDGHRYCDVYLSLAHPRRRKAGPRDDRGPGGRVDGVDVPEHLAYAPNHMWLDVAADGSCHAGLDAFFGRVFDRVDRIEPVTSPGLCRPGAMLRIRGVHFGLVFPKRLELQRFNAALRAEPSRVLSDPYGCGWLFSGRVPEGERHEGRASLCAGLIRGTDAPAWMERELRRMTACVHDRLSGRTAEGAPLAADGGEWQRPATQEMEAATVALLLNEFFSGAAGEAGHESMA